MSKRPFSSAAASTSKAKKAKTDVGQRSIDAFFQSPRKGRPPKTVADGAAVGAGTPKKPIMIEDEDEALARQLALEEGLDLEAVREQEEKWRKDAGLQPQEDEAVRAVFVDPVEGESTSVIEKPSPSKSKRSINLGASTSKRTAESYPDLTVDPLLLDPQPCPWVSGKTPYAFLSHAFVALSGTKSRILILNVVTNTLRYIISHDPESLTAAVYLLSNSLGPTYQPNTELNVGSAILTKALLSTTSLTQTALRDLYRTHGDTGDVAFHAKTAVRTLIPPAPLTVSGFYKSLLSISGAKGSGAAKRKEEIVRGLLVQAQGEEVRWVYRTLCMNLRVGAVRNTLLQAVARAFSLSPSPEQEVDQVGEEEFYVDRALREQVRPLPIKASKKKAAADTARVKAVEILVRAEAIVKRTYAQHPNYGHIIDGLLNSSMGSLPTTVPLSVGVPLMPTLGSPTRSLEEIHTRLGDLPFSAEMKYDGQRAQVHVRVLGPNENLTNGNGQFVVDVSDGRRAAVRVFSRHLEDMTDKYPDLLAMLSALLTRDPSLDSFILDAEVVALDANTGGIGSFQELSNRARKDVKLEDVKVSVGLFVFDLMYLNGKTLLGEPFRARRTLLRTYFPPYQPTEAKTCARLDWVENVDSEEGEDAVRAFWEKAINGKVEGLMVKLLDSGEVDEEAPKKEQEKGASRRKPLPATYEPDKRTQAWLKLKKDYVDSVGDSLDLIPIGAWHGNGRKARWWSPVLLAVWDKDRPVALCKCMSGFTDAFYKALNERYPVDSDTCSRTPLWDVDTGGYRPSVYFKPTEVWEIRGAELSLSPTSTTAKGLVSHARGLSLRFPRFLKLRSDKGIDNASTPELIADMWRSQQERGGHLAAGGMDEGELVDLDLDEGEEEEEPVEESSEEDN